MRTDLGNVQRTAVKRKIKVSCHTRAIPNKNVDYNQIKIYIQDVDKHVADINNKIKSAKERNLKGYFIAKLYYQVRKYAKYTLCNLQKQIKNIGTCLKTAFI